MAYKVQHNVNVQKKRKQNMSLTKDQEKIKRNLKRGDQKEISIRLDLNRITVWKVLNGLFNNDSVWEEAAKLAKENKARKDQFTQIASQL
jgi:hypothetical protein